MHYIQLKFGTVCRNLSKGENFSPYLGERHSSPNESTWIFAMSAQIWAEWISLELLCWELFLGMGLGPSPVFLLSQNASHHFPTLLHTANPVMTSLGQHKCTPPGWIRNGEASTACPSPRAFWIAPLVVNSWWPSEHYSENWKGSSCFAYSKSFKSQMYLQEVAWSSHIQLQKTWPAPRPDWNPEAGC